MTFEYISLSLFKMEQHRIGTGKVRVEKISRRDRSTRRKVRCIL